MGIVLSPETGQQVGQGGFVGGGEPPCPDELKLELPAELGALLAEFRLDDWLDVLGAELPDFDDDWLELLAELTVDSPLSALLAEGKLDVRLDEIGDELPEVTEV